ncbi:MAG: lipoyl(octanoyl) transferase LipB [Chitinophagales bacterium]
MYKIPNRKIQFQDLGSVSYEDAWKYQDELFQSVVAEKVANRKKAESEQLPTDNHLIFCNHPHVYTLGKNGSIDNLLLNEAELEDQNIEFFKINRGGDITYHGPGQIVGYPIMDLDNFFTDIHKFLRFLEEMVILTLAEYGLEAGRIKGATGVWLDGENPLKARKICAMGIRCSRWVTMHGWAFNVNANLDYFNNIVPCGITDKAVTSLHKELEVEKVDIEEVKSKLKKHFTNLFEAELVKNLQPVR